MTSGTYPQANGQVYGDGERGVNNQMPVEESGNLLCLLAPSRRWTATRISPGLYWKQLEQWADYLKAKGFDPENQLCTDDFAGHLAHNVNLTAKAICGLGAFAQAVRDARRHGQGAGVFASSRRIFAQRWVKEADDGDHFRLAFDQARHLEPEIQPGLGPHSWAESVSRRSRCARKWIFTERSQNQYGLPLDNRQTYTKLDWITWTATLTQDRADFEALVNPVYPFLNETPDRSPMTDWYQTKTATQSRLHRASGRGRRFRADALRQNHLAKIRRPRQDQSGKLGADAGLLDEHDDNPGPRSAGGSGR